MNAATAAPETMNREMVITRLLDAPRELVYRAWTDPEQVDLWWGPRGFRNTTMSREFAPGGAWRFTMHGPDGVDYDNKIVYLEIIPLEKLVYAHGEGDKEPDFHTTITFEAEGNKTRVTLRALFASDEACRAAMEYGATEGGKQTLARLAEYVAAQQAEGRLTAIEADQELVFTRLIDAPRERVFDAWTDPKQVVEWWGPNGFTTTIQEMDLRPGGVWSYVMHGPDGTDYPNRSTYVEVNRPSRLVYNHAGGSAGAPTASFQMTATFVDRGGKTEMIMRMCFPSTADREKIVAQYGAFEGGKQCLARLAAYVGKK